MSEEKRVSLITGGSMGIGRAICLELARPGDVICFNHYDPDDDSALETKKLLEEKDVTVDFRKFDISDPDQVDDYFGYVAETYGHLDNLINNAGITMDGFLIRMDLDAFERVLKVNLTGTFLCLKAAAKIMMKARKGSIVNMASVVGQIGNIGQANYSASKAGVMALTKTAAKELAGRGIRVNAIAPGFIETVMTADLPEKAAKAMRDMIPMKTTGKPEDVAKVVSFLCSDQARYVTGQVLHVNGGMYM